MQANKNLIIGSKQDKLEDIVYDMESIRHPNLQWTMGTGK